MLTQEQVEEILAHLERAQNPIFFYDNDADGLCSFLILRRFLGRGKGVAVRSYPDLNLQYARKARELKADYVFILDKPAVSKEFVAEIDSYQLPMVWIDHHDVPTPDFFGISNLRIYNPTKNSGKDKGSEPVTYLAYNLTKRKEDLWLAVVGCISDHYLPDFSEEFAREYPEYWGREIKKPFDAYYRTEIGKVAQAFNFGLKDSITNTVGFQNFLAGCKSPAEVFSEKPENQAFRKKYREIRKKYDSLLLKAKQNDEKSIIFFEYGGDLSISSDLSNELSYIYPNKFVAVAYISGAITNISLRGKGVKKILGRIIPKFEGASGGGHEDAVGARVRTSDLSKFKDALGGEIESFK